MSDATEPQRRRHRARHQAVRSVVVNDADTTSVEISSLLAQQSYRVGVAAKTGAGVGVSTTITVNTGSFVARTYALHAANVVTRGESLPNPAPASREGLFFRVRFQTPSTTK